MPTKSAQPNTWSVVGGDPASVLSYAPQVNPSPLTVGSGKGSLEIVITNPTNADIDVRFILFTIKVAPDAAKDGNALTSTTADINAVTSAATKWTVEKPRGVVTNGPAAYRLKPAVGESMPIPKGGSVVVQIYGFPINATAGTSTVQIEEATHGKITYPHFTVTTFPWGFAFSDLTANVPDGSGWQPVAQVEWGKEVTLFWHGSVVDTGSYTIYYSDSVKGQRTETPTTLGQWQSHKLTADTVFTLGVKTSNSVGDELKASMSVAVAVRNPELVAKSVAAQSATLKGLTIETAGGQPPSWAIDNSGLGLRIKNVGNPNVAASFDNTGALSVAALLAGKDGAGPSSPCALVAHGDLAFGGRVFVGDTTDTKKDGKRVPTKGLVLDGAYVWSPFRPSPRIRFIEDIDPAKEPNTQRHWNIDALNGNMRFFVEPGYDIKGVGLCYFDSKGNLTNYGDLTSYGNLTTYGTKLTINAYSYFAPDGNLVINTNAGTLSIDQFGNLICPGNVYVRGGLCQFTEGKWRQFYYGYYKEYAAYKDTAAPSDLRLKSEVRTVPSALEKVRRLRGVTFRWNEDGLQYLTRDVDATISAGPNATEQEHDEARREEREKRRGELAATRVGVVAQDVEAVLPEAVTTDADGYKSIRYDDLIPLLIEAVKEQDRLAARQQAEIERLKLAVSAAGGPTRPGE